MPEMIPYDEFGLFHENAEEYGIPYEGPPAVHRECVEVDGARQISALVWGTGPAELALLHGGAQNAHTWDTVALALARPLVAVDLPGHGHSDGGRGGHLDIRANAEDVAVALRALAPAARCVVGMSLGGLTALALADFAPDLVRGLVLVDITPGVDEVKASHITAFVNGPESFASFEDILERTIRYNPTRTVSSLRRGILHNAMQRPDGSWVWRYARHQSADPGAGAGLTGRLDVTSLWDSVSRLPAPLMLVRGMAEGSVVSDADEVELLRRRPDAQVVHVEGAGHSVQGDRPVELAAIIEQFLVALG
jgi:pimeloyl-ACP methyl ester carboxylesterase